MRGQQRPVSKKNFSYTNTILLQLREDLPKKECLLSGIAQISSPKWIKYASHQTNLKVDASVMKGMLMGVKT